MSLDTTKRINRVTVNGTDVPVVGIPTLQEKTVTPSTIAQKVVADGEYDGLGAVNVNAVTSDIDSNILPTNIRRGTTILGVQGNLEADKPDQSKTVTPTTSQQNIVADTGYELAQVTVNAVTSSIDANIQAENIKQGVSILGVQGSFEGSATPTLQEKSVTPTKSSQSVTADSGYDGLSQVDVGAIPDEYIVPSGTLDITANGTQDVTNYESVNVNVPSETPTLVTKEITANGTYNASDDGADGYSSVTVNVESGGDSSWTPDPTWVFPDPNGSNELKTIRQIYDEDTLKDTYGSYRSIYLIYGDSPTTNLTSDVLCTTPSTPVTFLFSDGGIYENISESGHIHTWDTSKDVCDSTGRPIRYVRVYGTSALRNGYIPHFKGSIIQAIYNLNSTPMCVANTSVYGFYKNLLSVDFGDIVTTPALTYSDQYNIRKIHCEGALTIANNVFGRLMSLSEITFPNLVSLSAYSSTAGLLNFTQVKSITIPSSCTTFNVYLNVNGNAYPSSLKYINFENNSKLTTIEVKQAYALKRLNNLPSGLTSFTITYAYSLEELVLPDTVSTLSVGQAYSLESIVIPSSVTSSLAYFDAPTLRHVVVPADFNVPCRFNSILLEKDDIVAVLSNLKDLTGSDAKTITLGSTNLEKLTDEEKAIATNKNWTLA